MDWNRQPVVHAETSSFVGETTRHMAASEARYGGWGNQVVSACGDLLVLVALIFFIFPVLAQGAPNWRVFKAADGLHESLVTAVSVGPKGTIWIRHGNADVITRFDGYEFSYLPAPEGLSRVCENADGQLWSGYASGLQEFREGRWIKHAIAEVDYENRTNIMRQIRSVPIVPGRRDQVFLLLSDRLLEFDAATGRATTLVQSDTMHIGRFVDLGLARKGGLWITGEDGLVKATWEDKGTNPAWIWREFFLTNIPSVSVFSCPLEDDEGGVTVVGEMTNTTERALVYLEAPAYQARLIATGRYRHGWRGLGETFWADSLNAVYQLAGTQWFKIETEGMLAGQFRDVAVEPKGVFWLATSEGLVRYAPLLWRQPRDMTPADAPVHALFETARGQLWAATAQNLMMLEEGRWTTFPLPENPELVIEPSDRLFATGDGRVGINTKDRLMMFDPRSGSLDVVKPSGGQSVRLLGRFRGNLYCVQIVDADEARSSYRLELFNGRRFSAFPTLLPPRNLGPNLHFIHITANGDIWLGGTAGVGCYREQRWQFFTPGEGNAPMTATGLLELRQGNLWISSDNRIYEFNGRAWSVVRSGFDRVNAMWEDADGSVWVASGAGLYRYCRGSWMMYGLEEGLPSEAVYEVIRDLSGRLWAGTAQGLSRFYPEADGAPPRVSISSEKNAENLLEKENLTLDFAGVDRWQFSRTERLLYSYHLDNEPWTPYRSIPAASLNDLSAGAHRFEVRVMDRNWNESLHPAVYEFTVRLPWYRETRLVIMLEIGLLIILFLAGLAVNRHWRLKKSYAEVERIVQQRTAELEEAQQALLHSQKMRALGTMAAGIAHDFNSILSIIKGSAQIIENNLEDKEKIRTRVSRIRTSVEQGSAIVKAFLGYGRAAKQELSPCEVNPVVEKAIKLLDDRLAEHAHVRFEPAAHLPKVIVAKDLLQQMLLNLVINAAEAMPDQGEIVLRTRCVDALPVGLVLPPADATHYIEISVQDFGCGIPGDILNRIFEPFFTTKALSVRHGTGLGLSMVFEFAKDQGCGLKVESVVGQGSTFTIYVPVDSNS
jgi:signal transduction histidine kinase